MKEFLFFECFLDKYLNKYYNIFSRNSQKKILRKTLQNFMINQRIFWVFFLEFPRISRGIHRTSFWSNPQKETQEKNYNNNLWKAIPRWNSWRYPQKKLLEYFPVITSRWVPRIKFWRDPQTNLLGNAGVTRGKPPEETPAGIFNNSRKNLQKQFVNFKHDIFTWSRGGWSLLISPSTPWWG